MVGATKLSFFPLFCVGLKQSYPEGGTQMHDALWCLYIWLVSQADTPCASQFSRSLNCCTFDSQRGKVNFISSHFTAFPYGPTHVLTCFPPCYLEQSHNSHPHLLDCSVLHTDLLHVQRLLLIITI